MYPIVASDRKSIYIVNTHSWYGSQSNSYTTGYNTADENEFPWFAAIPTNPPIAPFAKGPQDRGIFFLWLRIL
jgi:hypothetical protein